MTAQDIRPQAGPAMMNINAGPTNAPNAFAGATGLAAGAGALGGGQTNPLAQLMLRQMAANQPGGAGTPAQQAQAGMGQLGGFGGPLAQPSPASQVEVPGQAQQSPFFNASNAGNAQTAILKAGANGGQSQAPDPAIQQAIMAALQGINPKGMTGDNINAAFISALGAHPGTLTADQINQIKYNDQIQGKGAWGNGPAPINQWANQAYSAVQGTPTNLSSILLGGNS